MKISPFIFFSILIIAIVFSCKKPAVVQQPPDLVYKLRKVSGDAQTGAPFQAITPLRVKVISDSILDIGAENITVQFSVTHGGGTIDPAEVQTDQAGFASTTWTLGDMESLQRVAVKTKYVSGARFSSNQVEFRATSKDLVYTIFKTTGDNQVSMINKALAPLTVSVKDSIQNKAIPGIPVEFSVISGGGSINPAVVVSDQNGNATTNWTLGSLDGIQKVQVNSKYAGGPKFSTKPKEFKATASGSLNLSIVSGNNQSAPNNKPLMLETIVKVTNSSGAAVSGIPVSFKVLSGGSSWLIPKLYLVLRWIYPIVRPYFTIQTELQVTNGQ